MSEQKNKSCKVIVAGVGGQGAITIAQLILGAAHENGYHALQSEVHGMSQRGGAVNAHVIFSQDEVYSPVVMEGDADILIALEPLETLRYLSFLKKEAKVVVATESVINMDNYPVKEQLIAALTKIQGIELVDTEAHAKTLDNKRGGNIVLLGAAAKHMPMITEEKWHMAISARFAGKADGMMRKNLEAFDFGLKL